MAWHEGKPEYRSSPNSKEIRENFAYLKNHPSLPPVGSIIAYSPGYFTNGSNAGFTHQMVSANTVAAVNALLNSSGWYVCDGAALNDADSGIFNGAGRYLPNLTDDRFFMGDTVAGGIGGANSNNIAHTHTTGNHALTVGEMPEHFHYLNYITLNGTKPAPLIIGAIKVVDVVSDGLNFPRSTTARGSGEAHNHGSTGSAGSSSLENRPKYLSCFYIMRVK